MNQEHLRQLKESPHAQTVIDWFNEQLEKLNDISTHKSWDEVLGKQYASKILKDLSRFLESRPEQNKINNQYK